jgi:hypothetical protein
VGRVVRRLRLGEALTVSPTQHGGMMVNAAGRF